MHANWNDRLEALAPTSHHIGHDSAVAVVRRRWIQHEHAEADEGVAEEDCDGEQNHDEEDVNFLAEGAVCKGDC